MNPSNEKVEEKFDDPLESFENNVNINNEKESRNEEVNKVKFTEIMKKKLFLKLFFLFYKIIF